MQKNEVLINGGALNAPVVSALAAEQFLTENYCFRRNLLNGKVEFATKQSDGQASDYRPLTQEALNSIILRAKREDICEGSNPKTDIVEFIHSEEVCAYNPIGEYLDNLPQWDGQNHVAQLSRACQDSVLSSCRSSLSGSALRWPTGSRWTPCTATRLCLRSSVPRDVVRPPFSSACFQPTCASISWTI